MTQSTEPAAPDEHAAEREELLQLKALYEKAVRENDLDALRPHLDEQFSIVTFTDREFTDFEAFKARWNQTRQEILKGGSYTLELIPERSRFCGDLVIARGDSKNVVTTGAGKRYEFGSHWTVVCRKTDGQWKILRAHSSINPFGNPLLRAGVKKVVTSAVIGALVAGLLLGAGVTYLLTR
jgi:ketosteroid isomerase-like protein